MSTIDERSWQNLATSIVSEISYVDCEVRDVLKEVEQCIDKLRQTVDWDWSYYWRDGQPIAVYWDDASDVDKAMLQYAAELHSKWIDSSRKLHEVLQLLQQVSDELGRLK